MYEKFLSEQDRQKKLIVKVYDKMKIFKLLSLTTILGFNFATAQEHEQPACRSVKHDLAVYESKVSKVFELAEGTAVKDVLESTVQSTTPFTLFLPTNDAIDSVPSGTVNALLADSALREKTLLDHVWPKEYDLIGLLNLGKSLPYLSSNTPDDVFAGLPQSVVGGEFYFNVLDFRDGGTSLFNSQAISFGKRAFQGNLDKGKAKILYADRRTCAGTVFLIDKVIIR